MKALNHCFNNTPATVTLYYLIDVILFRLNTELDVLYNIYWNACILMYMKLFKIVFELL